MDFTLFNQVLSLALCLIILAAIILCIIKRPKKWGWSAPLLIYTLFSIAFYATLLFDGLSDSPDVMFWASTKSLLSYITIVIYCFGVIGAGLLNGDRHNDS